MTKELRSEGEALDIYARQGKTLAFTLYWKDDEDDAIDLTGFSARLQVRRTADEEPVISLTSGSGLTVTAATGQIDVLVSATTLAGIDGGRYRYDLEVQSGSSGTVTCLLAGRFFVAEEATK